MFLYVITTLIQYPVGFWYYLERAALQTPKSPQTNNIYTFHHRGIVHYPIITLSHVTFNSMIAHISLKSSLKICIECLLNKLWYLYFFTLERRKDSFLIWTRERAHSWHPYPAESKLGLSAAAFNCSVFKFNEVRHSGPCTHTSQSNSDVKMDRKG